MAKAANTVRSESLTVTLSEQSVELLEQIAARGIYGRNPAEVVGRLVDQELVRLVEAARLQPRKPPKRSRPKSRPKSQQRPQPQRRSGS
jgi:hypothetical protein